MKKVLFTILAGAALAAGTARAQFEGEIDMKISGQGGMQGTGKVLVSKAGSRSEMDMQTARMPFHMTTLMKFDKPDVLFLVNDRSKTYSEIDIKKAREAAAKMGKQSSEPYTVKVLGTETLLGYSTKHVLIARPGDRTEMEAWTTRDFLGLSCEAMRGLMHQGGGQDDGSMLKALKDAGADGFFVKMVTREKGKTDAVTTMELTKAEKKSLPAALFEIPPGYVKQDGLAGAAGVVSPEAGEQIRKAMENMTPEQRKQLEDMMKARQNGNN